jgi:flavodoxin
MASTEHRPARPGSSEYFLRVMARVEEKLWARVEAMRKNEEAARKPDAEELRAAFEDVVQEIEPVAFEAKLAAFTAKYGDGAWEQATARGLRRQARDEGR